MNKLIWTILGIILFIIGLFAGVYYLGKYNEKKKYDDIENTVTQQEMDSIMLRWTDRLDSLNFKREIIYKQTEKTYQQTIKVYEKINDIAPLHDRDKLLESVSRISATR